jgi:hypothetical protein
MTYSVCGSCQIQLVLVIIMLLLHILPIYYSYCIEAIWLNNINLAQTLTNMLNGGVQFVSNPF